MLRLTSLRNNRRRPGSAVLLALTLALAASAATGQSAPQAPGQSGPQAPGQSGPQAPGQSGPQALTEQARAARDAGNLKAAASFFEQAANQCGAPAQLALVDIYRKGEGRKADGALAYAWLISAQRASNDWSKQNVTKIERLTNELPAYMSGKQRHGAYCRGLKLLAKSCGAGGVLRRIERLLACS